MNAQPEAFSARLLLVDERPADRLAHRRALEQSWGGCSIQEAGSWEEGARLARSGGFDCVVLGQPGTGSLSFDDLAGLGGVEGGPAVPVVVLGGSGGVRTALLAFSFDGRGELAHPAGADAERVPGAVLQAVRAFRERRAQRPDMESLHAAEFAEIKYQNLVEQMSGIVYIAALDPPGQLLYVSPQVAQLGYTPGQWLEAPEGHVRWMHPEDRADYAARLALSCELRAPLRTEYRMLKRDGRVRWMLDQAKVVRSADGRASFLQGLLVDITEEREAEQELEYYRRRLEELVAQRTQQLERQSGLLWAANARMDQELCQRKEAESALKASESRFRQRLESLGEGVLCLDREGHCTYVNPAALSLFGCQDATEAEGQNVLSALCHCREQGGWLPEQPCPLLRTLKDGVPCRFNETLLRADGSSFEAELSAYPLRSGAGGAVVLVREVGQARLLLREAGRDALTGLLDRAGFTQRLNDAIAAAGRDGSAHALCVLDLDRFKLVNDSCGHLAGDHLLRSLAQRLRDALGQSGVLARLDGDAFGVLLEGRPIDAALEMAGQLREAIGAFRFVWEGEAFEVGASCGLVAVSGASGDAAWALGAAETACRAAKRRGRNRVLAFGPELVELSGAVIPHPAALKGAELSRAADIPRQASG
jgi:diguanylate cyclase (GGDEF)-like protein/PAS domain S-box-containing protein